jgi:hypothetical protein
MPEARRLKPHEVTTILQEHIQEGQYKIGDPLPTLDELNAEFFGVGAGSKVGRAAYAPLIAAGKVEARQGRNGGHFLIALESRSGSNALAAISADLKAVAANLAAVADRLLYVVEFQHIPTGTYFGECLHPSRLAAEEYAIDMLVRLGEERGEATKTVPMAGYTAADVSGQGHGVRIYGYTLGGERTDIHGRTH